MWNHELYAVFETSGGQEESIGLIRKANNRIMENFGIGFCLSFWSEL